LSFIRKHFSLLLAVLAIVALSDCGNNRIGHVAYVNLAGANKVAGYKIGSSGKLSAIQCFPFSGGSTPESVYIHPSKKFVYGSNQAGGDISLFSIDSSSGALTESSSRTTAGTNPTALAMDSNGDFLFVANSGSSSISVYSINSSSGALTPVTGSPFPTGSRPIALTVVSNKFLYVANANAATVSAYSISSSSGQLTQITGSPFAAGTDPYSVASDPGGHFL